MKNEEDKWEIKKLVYGKVNIWMVYNGSKERMNTYTKWMKGQWIEGKDEHVYKMNERTVDRRKGWTRLQNEWKENGSKERINDQNEWTKGCINEDKKRRGMNERIRDDWMNRWMNMHIPN